MFLSYKNNAKAIQNKSVSHTILLDKRLDTLPVHILKESESPASRSTNWHQYSQDYGCFSVYIVNQRTQIKQQIFNLTIGKCLESIPGAQMFTVIDKMSAHMVPKWISIRSKQNKIFAILPKVSLCINNINYNRNN